MQENKANRADSALQKQQGNVGVEKNGMVVSFVHIKQSYLPVLPGSSFCVPSFLFRFFFNVFLL